jgi:hypothetical protein
VENSGGMPVSANSIPKQRLEQDHRFVKKRMAASLCFRSIEGALRTIAGYEAMNVIRKGQFRWLAKGDVLGQVHYTEQIFGSPRNRIDHCFGNRAVLARIPFAADPNIFL